MLAYFSVPSHTPPFRNPFPCCSCMHLPAVACPCLAFFRRLIPRASGGRRQLRVRCGAHSLQVVRHVPARHSCLQAAAAMLRLGHACCSALLRAPVCGATATACPRCLFWFAARWTVRDATMISLPPLLQTGRCAVCFWHDSGPGTCCGPRSFLGSRMAGWICTPLHHRLLPVIVESRAASCSRA